MEAEVVAPPTPQSPINPDTLTSVTALARFEFEPGRSNDGSKVLMVEWQDDEHESRQHGSYHISWPGMRTVFPAHDQPADNIRRVFYLIPPGLAIPPHVTLAYHPPPETNATVHVEPQKKTFQPLPAIFTRELGATAKVSGKKGVLHTLWAKRRLQVLNGEIEAERAKKAEGIALERALDEKRYIEENFGLLTRPVPNDPVSIPQPTSDLASSPPLQSPKSAGGGGGGRRLSDKLKGLSLGTTDKDLQVRPNTFTNELHPLSPAVSDVAHSTFRSFRRRPASPQSGARSAESPAPTGPGAPSMRKVLAHEPPESIRSQQTASSISSFNFVNQSDSDNDDLFAVAIGPRSPDIAKSPFSFSLDDLGGSSMRKADESINSIFEGTNS
ncbi:hypothetical protein DV735_g1220, partial [Chaetothyriales sp. CBS 134920]